MIVIVPNLIVHRTVACYHSLEGEAVVGLSDRAHVGANLSLPLSPLARGRKVRDAM